MTQKYIEPPRIPRDEALAALSSPDPRAKVDALLSLALYDDDWKLIQEHCLQLLDDPDPDVVATAVLCFGHLARRSGHLDIERVVPALNTLRFNPAVAGRVKDVLDDIRIFVGKAPR